MNNFSNNPCENCGVCCLDFSLPPFDANELVRAPDELMAQIDDYAHSARHKRSNPCLWLDLQTGKCIHHQVRPILCRWFEPGCEGCNGLREKAGLPRLGVDSIPG